jgi:hypothetical protein
MKQRKKIEGRKNGTEKEKVRKKLKKYDETTNGKTKVEGNKE